MYEYMHIFFMFAFAEAPLSASFVYPTKKERFKKLGISCSRDPPPHSSYRSETIGGPRGNIENRDTQRTHTLAKLTPTISSLNHD